MPAPLGLQCDAREHCHAISLRGVVITGLVMIGRLPS
jgi:hypothetical protein